ncbi:diacylglycerol kinase family protein [Mesorhizobium australicum]|uniref:diacylglycerol kinase family protein n=1 Tax=Mesorhizobium australicum TaxID=536018 RepID=UPI003EBF1BAD
MKLSSRQRLSLKTSEWGSRATGMGGGDGTLGSAASALAGTDLVLGVLPLGTHFGGPADNTQHGTALLQRPA